MDRRASETSGSATHCHECDVRLAFDQRYCLTCGARRGPLPAYVTPVAGGLSFGAVGAQLAAATATPPLEAQPVLSSRFDAWLFAPRAAAVAVMSTLGFGVVVGSMVAESSANTGSTIYALAPGGSSAAAAGANGSSPAGGGGGGGGGGDGGGTRTVTVGSTTPAPSTAAPTSGGSGSSNQSPTPGNSGAKSTPGALPPVKHVFLIMLSDQGYNQTFGHASADPYLARTLVKKGEVIPNYYAVASSELANEVALLSGQGPTQDTLANCPTYTDVQPGTRGTGGQVMGNGCVYPESTKTLAGELTKAHHVWRAYLQTSRKVSQICHAPSVGQAAPTQPAAHDPYVDWRNPFLYFRSLTAHSPCSVHDVTLSRLTSDLHSASKTPTLSYIVPDLCHDGSDAPCKPNAPAGMGPADTFLKSVVPAIERSPAYKAGGLIAITFDEAPQSGPNADQSSCCNNPTYPNTPTSSPSSGSSTDTTSTTTTTGPATSTTSAAPTTPTSTSTTNTSPNTTTTASTTSTTTASGTAPTTTTGTTTTTPPSLGSGVTSPTGGGGQVGLLLLSKYVSPGTSEVTDYFNHFSLLASLEQLLGVPRIGYATDPSLALFGAAVYNASGG
jgi:hypothetical protein